jgi:hypothetical protein
MRISWPHMGSLEFVLGSVFEEPGMDCVLRRRKNPAALQEEALAV